ncbi:iron dicitrate transporter FecR [Bacteroidia bacterium]|nr:iron dicitrate transporter FecR [Bacteroidia bacterium]
MKHTKQQSEANSLISCYLLGTITENEMIELKNWCKESPDNMAFFEHICSSRQFGTKYELFQQIDKDNAYADFVGRTGTEKSVFKRIQPFLKYAAAVILILSVGLKFFQRDQHESQELTQITISPGKAQAILVLDDGTQLYLNPDSLQQIQSGQALLATNNSTGISYNTVDDDRSEDKYNTLVIPRGGEYHLTLSDGTKVHLNSASELKYPVNFNQKSREVFLKGEAYFEVAKDSDRLFYVNTEDISIKQYGTAFNVNTYAENIVQVILVKGSIGVLTKEPEAEYALKVSQLAEYNKENHSVKIQTVDVRTYIAWNEGKFIFENKKMETIMETLSLWYDMDVQFGSNDLKNILFTGSIDRDNPMEDILKAIEFTTNVHIRIKGKVVSIDK